MRHLNRYTKYYIVKNTYANIIYTYKMGYFAIPAYYIYPHITILTGNLNLIKTVPGNLLDTHDGDFFSQLMHHVYTTQLREF